MIYGFNTFLPPGFRIDGQDIPGYQASLEQGGRMQDVGAEGHPVMPPARAPLPAQGMPPGAGGLPIRVGRPAAAREQGQPMEFDHAIQYVTRIKRRFQTEPQIYKSFLEILHSYQRNREDIKAVLDRVSELFADHEDLLSDFAYFLPDTIQS